MIKFGCKKNTLKLDRVGSRLNIKVNKKLSVFSGRGSKRHVIFDYHARANIQL